eukprot:3478919-Prymnesium_polylepis.1
MVGRDCSCTTLVAAMTSSCNRSRSRLTNQSSDVTSVGSVEITCHRKEGAVSALHQLPLQPL